jgi:hypothetical protein
MALRMINERRAITDDNTGTWIKSFKATTKESLDKFRERKQNMADGQEWREHLCTHDDNKPAPCLTNHVRKEDGKLITVSNRLDAKIQLP